MPYRDKHGNWFDDDGDPMEYVGAPQDQDDDGDTPRRDPKWRRDLEDRARKGSEATKRVEKLERRLALYEAGIDVSDPKARYFVNGYDGDLDPAAIRAAAQEIGLVAPDQPSGEQESLERMSAAQQGGAAPGARDLTAEMRALRSIKDPEEGKRAVLALAREAGMNVEATGAEANGWG